MTMDSENIDEQRLLAKLNETAATLMDKKIILETRDKLLRLNRNRQTDISKAKAIIGTCPDMCPEIERYFRIETNQVSPFEMDIVGNPNARPDERRMIKEYRRSGADQEEPLAHELRPIPVLQYTMEYLCLEVIDLYETEGLTGEWFDFIWSRTRSIRKDLTQQHLTGIEAVELTEQCARFHIFCTYFLCEQEMKDFDPKINEENLNNCLQTLKDCYDDLNFKEIQCPNESEFRSYDILLNLKNGDTLSELKHFQPEIKHSSNVQLAIKLYQSFNNRNHVRFFDLVKRANFFQSCILNRYLNEFRLKILNIKRKAYSTAKSTTPVAYPIDRLLDILAFDDFQELTDFSQRIGLEFDSKYVYLHRQNMIDSNGNITNLKTRSINLVMKKLVTTPGLAILNCRDFDHQNSFRIKEVQSSFDENNKLLRENYSIEPNKSFDSSQATIKFNFNDQIKMLENHKINSDIKSFESSIAPSFKEIVPIKTPAIDYSKIINDLKYSIYDSIANEIIRTHVKNNYSVMKSLINDSRLYIKYMLEFKITRTLNNIFTMQKHRKIVLNRVSIFLLDNMLTDITRRICMESYQKCYSNHKNQINALRKNLFTISIDLFNDFIKQMIITTIQSTIIDESKRLKERIKQWRQLFLQKKYWRKWFEYYLMKKRYQYICNTFPAVPSNFSAAKHIPNGRDKIPNQATIIDDCYIRIHNSFKRKLAYSNIVSKNVKKQYIEHDDRSLMRKYFKSWRNQAKYSMLKRIRNNFPSAPTIPVDSIEPNKYSTITTINNLTIIDPTISNANKNFNNTLLKKLNYDYDSTVALIRNTLNERRRQRESS